jgi:hypothetical protein
VAESGAAAADGEKGVEKEESKKNAAYESKLNLGFNMASGGFGALSKSSTEAFITKQTPASFFSSFNSQAKGGSGFGATSPRSGGSTFGSGFGATTKTGSTSGFGSVANKTSETKQFAGGMGTASTDKSSPNSSFFGNSTVLYFLLCCSQRDTNICVPPQAATPLALDKGSKVSNGEDEFSKVLEVRCKMYKLVEVEVKGEEGKMHKKWSECGEGPLRLLAPKKAAGEDKVGAQTLARLVMRRAEIKTVILNSVLGKLSTVNKQGDKSVRFACMGEGGKLESYFFKVRPLSYSYCTSDVHSRIRTAQVSSTLVFVLHK